MTEMRDAIRLYYSGELFEAEKILKLILMKEPENINALIRFAAIQEDLGRKEEAGAIYLKLAKLYEKEASYNECLTVIEKASPVFPQADIAPLKGKCLFSLGCYNEALSNFLVSPVNNQNLYYIGKIYFILNQYNDALRVFREILSKATNSEETFRACYWVGKSLYNLGELDDAISCFKSYISVYPDETQVYLDLALCYLKSGCLDEARNNLIQYQNLGGNAELANLYLGIVNYRLGKYKKAIFLLDQTSKKEHTLYWKGLAYYKLSLYEDAIECFSTAAKYEAKPIYYKMMGNSHLELGNFFEAKICFEKALNIDSLDEELRKLISVSENLLKVNSEGGK
ncbi:MAG: Tetratricopeptide repeat protein [Pelotomaculum sp. PtaU1.Bin035]|nr:MAG: Tetratricopeptide repeat protein [Pelotomaculum sp. PtaU1.Bin035]